MSTQGRNAVARTLTAYIAQDLRQRILSATNVPANWTLAALAADYNVSVTPVRAALKELEQQGLVEHARNGRYRVDPDDLGTGSRRIRVTSPPGPEDWDRLLIREVMLASLQRTPVYLRETAVAARFSAGRSVIRQALTRLAGAALVHHVPRRGWLVQPLRNDDVADFLEIRETLEIKALRLAQPSLDPAELQRLLDANPVPEPGTPPRLNNEMHHYIVEVSGNRYIQDFFRHYVARFYTALFDYATPAMYVIADQALRHRRVLLALRAGHWRRAERELSAHIWSQADILRSLLEHEPCADDAADATGSGTRPDP